MAVKKMWLLPCGWLTVEKSSMVHRVGLGVAVDIPVVAALIETDDGFVLFDTGLDPESLTNPASQILVQRKVIKSLTKENDIRLQLRQLGLKPADIRYVVNSHLHYDHTGGNRFFTSAQIYVQKSEYRFAHYPDTHVAYLYLKHQFDHPLQYELLEGDHKVVDGVYVTATPGHSPGHQSLLVELPKSGLAILVGDAMYCRENMERNVPPGNVWDMTMSVISMSRLIYLAERENGKLFIMHDPQFWEEHKPAPHFYE